MAQPFQLQTVLELAAQRLDAATIELQGLRTRWEEAQSKLDQLRAFRDEYRARLAIDLKQGLEADRLRDFHAFLAKLERAIETQSGVVERCRHSWQEAYQRWLQLRSREQAMRVLRQRHMATEAEQERRVEQKQQDERATKSNLQDQLNRPLE